MPTYTNGAIPAAALRKTTFGVQLTAAAAHAADRLNAAYAALYGKPLRATDGYRSRAVQEKIFTERYEQKATGTGPYGDVRTWPGHGRYVRARGAAAAVPGTSNHGLGLALDIADLGGFSGTVYKRLAALAPAFGFTNTEGKTVGEPWHWVYDRAHDQRRPVKYRITKATAGRPGKVSIYSARTTDKTGRKVTRRRKVGTTVKITHTEHGRAWTAKGDWLKTAKITKEK